MLNQYNSSMDELKRKRLYLARLRYHCRHGKVDANGDAVEMLLDMDGLDTLLEQAGITIWDVGRGKGAYCLGRMNDIGPYAVDNARFITQEQNGLEWWNNRTEEEQERHIQRSIEFGPLGGQYGYLGGYNRKR